MRYGTGGTGSGKDQSRVLPDGDPGEVFEPHFLRETNDDIHIAGPKTRAVVNSCRGARGGVERTNPRAEAGTGLHVNEHSLSVGRRGRRARAER